MSKSENENNAADGSVESSDLFGDALPVFATEEDAQKFRDDYSTEMEPILKEQRKARVLSELDARYPMRRELKRCAAALQLLEQRYGCGSARLVIDGETATISQVLDEADGILGNILPNAKVRHGGPDDTK
jgi:hypothetical protein